MRKKLESKFKEYTEIRTEVVRNVPAIAALLVETEPKRQIALMLIRLRKTAKLSQKDVSERAGWNKGFVSRLEGAQGGIPDSQTLARYAQACGAAIALVVGTAPDRDHIHVIDAVTLHSGPDENEATTFERLRDQDLALSEE